MANMYAMSKCGKLYEVILSRKIGHKPMHKCHRVESMLVELFPMRKGPVCSLQSSLFGPLKIILYTDDMA